MADETERILRRLGDAYATCSTYCDDGEVRITSKARWSPPGRPHDLRPFRTRFARGGGFLFEFRDRGLDLEALFELSERTAGVQETWDRYVIWTESGSAHTWWTIDEDHHQHALLRDACEIAAGVSSRSSCVVPLLLDGVPPEEHPDLRVFRAARLAPDEVVDGRPCRHLVAPPTKRLASANLWVDAERACILRLRVHRKMGAGAVRAMLADAMRHREQSGASVPEEIEKEFTGERAIEGIDSVATTTFRPLLDLEVAPQELVFEPTT